MRAVFFTQVASGLARFLSAVVLGLIAFYQGAISPWLGPKCRFYPSCSVYAAECIRRYGPAAGLLRALGRLARCHPFHPGGFDPPGPVSPSIES
ncbi:MAG TPA: membrane protein insertion efficiency factor YidD [Polyangia bacterium]|nr:membrane protein insertion efficiency factor YidD [Polyangia bacterium]